MVRAGSRSPGAEAGGDLCVQARLEVTAKQVHRVAEDVGRPVEDWTFRQVPAKISRGDPRAGAHPLARTREVKPGGVFTRTGTDEEGGPAREPLTNLINVPGCDDGPMAAWSGRLDPGRVEDIPGQANLLIAQFARNAPAAPDGRTVIGQGLQHSGMFWSLRGAIIASR